MSEHQTTHYLAHIRDLLNGAMAICLEAERAGKTTIEETDLNCENTSIYAKKLSESEAEVARLRQREKLCETMDAAEKLSLIRALQEIRDETDLIGDGVSPREIVEAVRKMRAELLEARVRSARLLERSGLGQAIINGIIKNGMVRAVEPQLSVFKADAAEHLEAVVADWQENSVKCENCENYVLDYATDPEGIVVCIECNEGLEGETK